MMTDAQIEAIKNRYMAECMNCFAVHHLRDLMLCGGGRNNIPFRFCEDCEPIAWDFIDLYNNEKGEDYMEIANKDLKRRLIEISYKNKLSHLGSVLTAVDIINDIYEQKKPDEKFILSSGHAGLALYCVIEAYGGRDAEEIFAHHGVHPDRCAECGIDCSTGSLGQGLPIAVGMALADRTKNVFCLISDGECAEGSIWEALRVRDEERVNNLKVYANINGWGAYKRIDRLMLGKDLEDYSVTSRKTSSEYIPFLKGQDAHYYVMNEQDYEQAMSILQ